MRSPRALQPCAETRSRAARALRRWLRSDYDARARARLTGRAGGQARALAHAIAARLTALCRNALARSASAAPLAPIGLRCESASAADRASWGPGARACSCDRRAPYSLVPKRARAQRERCAAGSDRITMRERERG